MSQRSRWLLLAPLGLSSCLVPGLEVGPDASAAGTFAVGAIGSGLGGAAGSSNLALGGALFASAGQTAAGATAGGAGAQAGSGGDEAVVRCDEHPVPPKSTWAVTASTSSLGKGVESDPLFNPPMHVADGMLDERWASGQPQEEGQWFHVDFGVDVALSHVILQQGNDLDDYPRGYAISISNRHTDFDAEASATGHGASVSEAVIPLNHAVVGRYMLIRQTGSAKSWWSIAEISVECH